jgi:phosphoglycerate dehydrogenase-like enzyme
MSAGLVEAAAAVWTSGRARRRHSNVERLVMKIVVIGGGGLIGSKVATMLSAQGHDVIAASRRSGVDSLTGEGLATPSPVRVFWSMSPINRCSTRNL